MKNPAIFLLSLAVAVLGFIALNLAAYHYGF